MKKASAQYYPLKDRINYSDFASALNYISTFHEANHKFQYRDWLGDFENISVSENYGLFKQATTQQLRNDLPKELDLKNFRKFSTGPQTLIPLKLQSFSGTWNQFVIFHKATEEVPIQLEQVLFLEVFIPDLVEFSRIVSQFKLFVLIQIFVSESLFGLAD